MYQRDPKQQPVGHWKQSHARQHHLWQCLMECCAGGTQLSSGLHSSAVLLEAMPAAAALPAATRMHVSASPTAQSRALAVEGEHVALTEAAGRQGSEGQMMLLPAGVSMNDLLSLAEEMDPLGSPGRKDKQERRGLTAESTMQLASYLASKVWFTVRGQAELLLSQHCWLQHT